MRINKYIAETGYCSRREVDQLITTRRVTINGRVAELGSEVDPDDDVRVNGKPISHRKAELVYLALNKPRGITSTTESGVHGNIVDFVDHKERIFPIGRLDKDSEGLILLTNDGDIVNKILRKEGKHEKEYVVTVNRPLTPQFLRGMANGVRILGTKTLPAQVFQEGEKVFRIILTQGLNRQIRRMCEALGYDVRRLQRVRVMNVLLNELQVGEYRNLTEQERQELFETLDYTPERAIAKTKPAPAPSTSQPSTGRRTAKPRSEWKPRQGGERRQGGGGNPRHGGGQRQDWNPRQGGEQHSGGGGNPRHGGGQRQDWNPREGGEQRQGGGNPRHSGGQRQDWNSRQGGEQRQGGGGNPRHGGGQRQDWNPREGGEQRQGGGGKPRHGGGGQRQDWNPRQGGEQRQGGGGNPRHGGGQRQDWNPREGGEQRQGGGNPRHGGGQRQDWNPRQGGEQRHGQGEGRYGGQRQEERSSARAGQDSRGRQGQSPTRKPSSTSGRTPSKSGKRR